MGYYCVGSVLAHVMYDSGSGIDMVSPEFVGSVRPDPLFNTANIKKYNVLHGMPFLQKAACLDFSMNEVIIGRKKLPSQYCVDAPTAMEHPPKALCSPHSMLPEPLHSAVGEKGGGVKPAPEM
ncbi:hypothetical protein FRC12_006362 [Ceratobasidium sp. 428]|nr:hypothetical protein FRC12_006362 [Ceratobasidium sp. 428]